MLKMLIMTNLDYMDVPGTTWHTIASPVEPPTGMVLPEVWNYFPHSLALPFSRALEKGSMGARSKLGSCAAAGDPGKKDGVDDGLIVFAQSDMSLTSVIPSA